MRHLVRLGGRGDCTPCRGAELSPKPYTLSRGVSPGKKVFSILGARAVVKSCMGGEAKHWSTCPHT